MSGESRRAIDSAASATDGTSRASLPDVGERAESARATGQRPRWWQLLGAGALAWLLTLLVASNPWNLVWIGKLFGWSVLGVWMGIVLFLLAANARWPRVRVAVAVGVPLVLVGVVLSGSWLLSGLLDPRPGPSEAVAESPSGDVSADLVRAGHDERFWSVQLTSGSGLLERESLIITMILAMDPDAATPTVTFVSDSTVVVAAEGCSAEISFSSNLSLTQIREDQWDDGGCLWGAPR